MKKYLLLMLLVLIGMGASASTEIQLELEKTTSSSDGWSSQVVTNAKEVIKEGDLLIFSFDAASSTDQYAISNENGVKIYTEGCKDNEDWYDCANGQKDFVLTVTRKFYDAIQSGGLRLQYKGLKNLNGHIKRFEDGNFYKPTGSNVTEIMSTPQYIKDWYSDGYVLTTDQDYVNKTLRVVCMETGDDAYAFLKRNDDGWPSLMSGSDKFSIAGWKYFEIKINDELNELLKGNGLLIGGNNYYIAGIYVYDDGLTAPNWGEEESDIVDTYDFQNSVDGPVEGSSDWASRTIAGSFFEFKGWGQQRAIEPTTKIANTKNNIIRLYLENTASNTQIYAKDAVDSKAAYIRERKYDKTNKSFYYQNFADCGVADHYDFELSDAITVFADYNKPIINDPAGVKTGMLSTLLLNGMNVGINHGKITKVEIRKSMVSKYVTGYAIYTGHKLSSTYWRSVALPYNLSREQLEKAFGKDVVICELGESKVTKEKTTEEGNLTHYHYGISFNFTKIPDGEGINANYPYMIKLKSGVKPTDFYPIESVKADVRDYQAYEFRTGQFDLSALDAKEPTAGDKNYDELNKIYKYEQDIQTELIDARMIFKSTAPVFDITNTGVDKVEIIKDTSNKTVLNIPSENNGATNYYLYDNVLYPVKDTPVKLSSGLAYVVFPAATRILFEQPDDTAQAGAKITYFFCDENETTGIEEIDMTPASVCKAQQNVYSLDGQLVHKGLSVEGLAKGIYIVNGKKVIIK